MQNNKHLIKQPNILSAIHPAHLSEVPTPSTSFISEDMDQHIESDVHLSYDDLTKTIQNTSPSFSTFNQAELDDLVHDFELSKVNSKPLASRLKETNALVSGTNIMFFRTREHKLVNFDEKQQPVMAISLLPRHSRTLRTHGCRRVFTR